MMLWIIKIKKSNVRELSCSKTIRRRKIAIRIKIIIKIGNRKIRKEENLRDVRKGTKNKRSLKINAWKSSKIERKIG